MPKTGTPDDSPDMPPINRDVQIAWLADDKMSFGELGGKWVKEGYFKTLYGPYMREQVVAWQHFADWPSGRDTMNQFNAKHRPGDILNCLNLYPPQVELVMPSLRINGLGYPVAIVKHVRANGTEEILIKEITMLTKPL